MKPRGCAFGSLAIMCCLLASRAAASEPPPPPATPNAPNAPSAPAIQAWGVLIQVVDAVTSHVATKSLNRIHDEDMRLYSAVSFMISKDQLASMEGQDELTTKWVLFSRKVADLHAAADAFDQQGSEARLKTVLTAFEELEASYDPALLAAARASADRQTCPMHPDVIGKKDDLCPKCGMALDLPVKIQMYQAGAVGVAPHTIRASIRTERPLTVGERSTARLTLRGLDGLPVSLDALREVHTKKIHLLIIDSSLTDYHHEHPEPTRVPGEYTFSFTPRKPGPYRAWADIQPYATGFQEYAIADIGASGAGEPLTDRTVTTSATVEGLSYKLTFDPSEIHAGQPVKGTLRVTKTKRGAPFKKLEPLMGAFAHIVAFNEDRETVLHIHPKGVKLLTDTDRGGPDLGFQFYATKPGFYRLFVQVQIDGVSKFAPFGLQVLP